MKRYDEVKELSSNDRTMNKTFALAKLCLVRNNGNKYFIVLDKLSTLIFNDR